jgi:hypothetical protein
MTQKELAEKLMWGLDTPPCWLIGDSESEKTCNNICAQCLAKLIKEAVPDETD